MANQKNNAVLKKAHFIAFAFMLMLLPCRMAWCDTANQKQIPACQISYKGLKQKLFDEVKTAQNHYVLYKAAQEQIRLITYHFLWQARIEGEDPLNKIRRQGGKREEERLNEMVQSLEQNSAGEADALARSLRKIQTFHGYFLKLCMDRPYQDCILKEFQPLKDFVENGTEIFSHVLEKQREYRLAVDLASGGRDGLYPEDTLESAVEHKDYYVRFELDRHQVNFRLDHQMHDFFYNLLKKLNVSFEGDDCCLSCGKTEWQAKTDQMFNEVLQN